MSKKKNKRQEGEGEQLKNRFKNISLIIYQNQT